MVKKVIPPEKQKGVADAGGVHFEADAAKAVVKPPAGTTLKVRRVGNSLGVVLPKEVLAKLRVGEGELLSVSEVEGGVALRPFNDRLQEQIEAGRRAMKRYRNALRELAK
ncbi:MAG: AbrB/MazE/SpoVT family DNA-binding domain-containing protein [Hyphomonadaceae bacterium]|nr:AbrB/MazE/SpoVT family DNA-binding domain-containing protein [Hyphomonadaceae bacterium]